MRVSSQSGFTLIEVLSVLVIIGLMSSAVVLSMPRPKPAVITQSTDVLLQMNRAAQAGLISGDSYAFGLSQSDYQIYKFNETEWEPEAIKLWDDSVTASLEVEGQEVKIGKENIPVIVFEPTGLSTPFTLTLKAEGASRTLLGDGAGRVSLGPRS